MVSESFQARMSERLERSRARLEAKAERSAAKLGTLQADLEALAKELENVDEALNTLEETADSKERERLETQRERLLAKEERLRWKQELVETQVEAYREAAEGLEAAEVGPFRGRTVPEPEEQEEADRVKILQMVADGTITADEAAKLLEALDKGERRQASQRERRARVIRVRVSDLDTNTSRVNITLPLGIVRAALRRGRPHADIDVGGVSFDADELETLLNSGALGHIVDIVDEEDGERVEVIVE